MKCERCESMADGVYLLRFADEGRFFRLCLDCLDLYRHAIQDEDFEELEELEDPCEIVFLETPENAENPE